MPQKQIEQRSSIGNQNIAPSFIDIFAGCGGLSLGLMRSGWQGLFAVEKDENAFATLQHNLASPHSPFNFVWPKWLPSTPHTVDEILQQYRNQLEALAGHVDMVVGGPPCQGFSSAGRRDPNDPRNKLVESYLDFVSLIRPKIVLIENVRGITSDFGDGDGRTTKINYAKKIISALADNYVVSTRVIDASTFGVPQRRQRFFVIAIQKGLDAVALTAPFEALEQSRLSFLISKGIGALPISSKAALSDLEVQRNGVGASRDTKGFSDILYNKPMTAYQKLMNAGTRTAPSDTRLARHKAVITARFRDIIEICHSDGRLNVSLSREMRDSFGLRKCALRVLDPNSPSPTITSMPDDLLHYSEPRILTVRENARLQSFPDWFAFQGKYTTGGDRRKKEVPRFTQVANAVPPLLAEAIGATLLKYRHVPHPTQQVLKGKVTSQKIPATQLELA